MKALPFIIVFAVMWPITYGMLFADMRRVFPLTYHDECRHIMGGAMLIGALPPMWVVVPFLTGFAEHGFQWTCLSEPGAER